MKNGIAASGNLLIAPNISLTIASRLRFACQAPTRLASPIDTATETLSAKHSIIVRNIVDGIGDSGERVGGRGQEPGYCAVSSSCRRGSSRQPTMPSTQKRPPIGTRQIRPRHRERLEPADRLETRAIRVVEAVADDHGDQDQRRDRDQPVERPLHRRSAHAVREVDADHRALAKRATARP